MRLSDIELPIIALENLRQQKLRSYLTLAGIVIGIVIIVALVSVGQSMQKSIERQFESLGMNAIFLEPGNESSLATTAIARTIKEEDVRLVESVPHVKEVVPFYEGSATMKKGDEETGVIILGIRPEQIPALENIGYIGIKEGRAITKGDKYNMVIYEDFTKNAFKDEIKLRERLEVNDVSMRVVGISKPMSFMGFGFSNMIIVSKDSARELFNVKDPMELMITVTDKSKIKEAKARIEYVLEKAHGEKDFYLMSSEEILQASGIVLSLVQIILLGIASISIVVGGVGIMNTMLMSVIERTREIGVMKAIGATNSRVLSLFLAESAIIGAIGGIIGIAIGLLIAYSITVIAGMANFDLPFVADFGLLLAIFIFSIAIGAAAGYVPAKRAASLDPVEALHYE